MSAPPSVTTSPSKTADPGFGRREPKTSLVTTQWLDGRLVDADDPELLALVRATDTAKPSCYTTVRVTAGRALHGARHMQRLQRDANTIGLGSFDPEQVLRACDDLGRTVFANETGIVRIEARRGAVGKAVTLHATTRPLGVEKSTWRAVTLPTAHVGPGRFPGAKLAHRKLYEDARAVSQSAGADEALLFDRAGRLVEGARANLLISNAQGRLETPDVTLGAVAGIALEVVGEHVGELAVATIRMRDVLSARELIAVNAVRGACPITQLDGRSVGNGEPGPWQGRLDALLSG